MRLEAKLYSAPNLRILQITLLPVRYDFHDSIFWPQYVVTATGQRLSSLERCSNAKSIDLYALLLRRCFQSLCILSLFSLRDLRVGNL